HQSSGTYFISENFPIQHTITPTVPDEGYLHFKMIHIYASRIQLQPALHCK
ncbi:hypothetical protein ABG768_000066, partial [Culter alburnus]